MSEIGGGNDSGMETGGSAETGSLGETSSAVGGEVSAGSVTSETSGEISEADAEGISAAPSTAEIEVDSSHTTHGMNQIMETPATLEQAQIDVENFHNQSIEQILEMNGKYISQADRSRIENGADCVTAVEHNPNSGHSGLYRFSEGKSNIEVSAINKDQMERTAKHETNHFASKNREIIVPQPEKGGYTVYQTVGMRQSSWFHSAKTGENSSFETKGRGFNEGVTTMFTNEQLNAESKEKGEKAERESVYSHATEVCRQLQETMGKDAIGEAYYGGKTMALQEKMDALGGKGTYESFQSSMDKTISKDYAERVEGMREAQDILERLNEAKETKEGGNTT